MAQIVTAVVPAPTTAYAVTGRAQAVRAVVPPAAAAPTKAEYDILADLANDLRQSLINAGLAK